MHKPYAILLLISWPAFAEAPGTPPMSRDASLRNAFQVMCELEPPNFAHIEAKARAMQLVLQDDKVDPVPNGGQIRHEAWLGTLKTGPFGLHLDELSGPKGTSTSCGVFGSVADVDAFRNELVAEMKLPPASSPRIESGFRPFI